ncbi:MAG: 6-carboxytetrahydropterin synthase QueD [Planctomycetia bacterium]|nr:6-carboxytetrahydropterin synthase QueD [Planctomycetia bacterium]
MYTITRQFTFSYGHRLLNYEGKCGNLHGHNAKVRVTLAAKELNRQGMVLDFSELKKRVNTWLDEHWDHRMILRQDDPLVPALVAAGEPICTVPENPTAEFMAKSLFDTVREEGFAVVRVDFWETVNCFATWSEDEDGL